MDVLEHIAYTTKLEEPIALTIGNFDGIHSGHRAILNQLHKLGKSRVVLTFSNHSAEILGKSKPLRITSLEHKKEILNKLGIDVLVLLPFTELLSQQSPEGFLSDLKKCIPFSHLVLGHGAAFGYKRQGTQETISILADKLEFQPYFVPPVIVDDQIVSSSLIRTYIMQGKLDHASLLLGRPYSVFGKVTQGTKKGRTIGYPTANIDVREICLPPLGVYVVDVVHQNNTFTALANLGRAPTMHTDRPACLEVHCLDMCQDLYDHRIEVIFRTYLRPERHFGTIQELQAQIEKDIKAAHDLCVMQDRADPS